MCSWSSNVRFQRVCLQRETHSSPAPKVFVSGGAQNAFVASDECVCLQRDVVFGGEEQRLSRCWRSTHSSAVWYRIRRWNKLYLEKTPKRTETRGKVSEKSTETRPGWESLKNPTPLRNDAGPLSGLQRNALASLVHFVVWVTKWTRDASALRWRPERGPASFRSGVGFLRLSHPGLVSVLFSAPSLLQMKFFSETFPP